jgi:hypothetical protein
MTGKEYCEDMVDSVLHADLYVIRFPLLILSVTQFLRIVVCTE